MAKTTNRGQFRAKEPPCRETVERLYGQGLSIKALAREVGRHSEVVRRYVREWSLTRPTPRGGANRFNPTRDQMQVLRRMIDDGLKWAEIGAELGCCSETVRRYCAYHGIKKAPAVREGFVPPEMEARILALWNEYVSADDIGREVGRGRKTVESVIKRARDAGETVRPGRTWRGVAKGTRCLPHYDREPGIERTKIAGCNVAVASNTTDDAARFAALMFRTVAHHRAKREARG